MNKREISRRKFLQLSSVVLVGVASVACISPVKPLQEQRENYKGREVFIKYVDGEPQLTIDGEGVDTFTGQMLEQPGFFFKGGEGPVTYSTSYLPFTDYSSVMEMARDLIDYVPDFSTTVQK